MSNEVGFFIDHDPKGKPYLGLMYQSGGISTSMFIVYKEGATGFRKQLGEAIDKLRSTPDKIAAVNGFLPTTPGDQVTLN